MRRSRSDRSSTTASRRRPRRRSSTATALRYTYATLAERVRRLASALAALGVAPGSTVAIMDWDSHRYLECFFAVPMMGAVLHTVNVRISPEQVLYTINHAADDVILVNAEFLPLLDAIHDRDPAGREVRADQRRRVAASERDRVRGGIRVDARGARPPCSHFPDLDENTRATTFYTTGTTGLPKGVYYSHRQLVLHTLRRARMRSRTRRTRRSGRATSTCRSRRCSTSTPGACRTSRRCSASSRSIRDATCRTCCSA